MQRLFLCFTRGYALICSALSALLYAHYLAPGESGLCGGASGCESVRRSGFGYFFDTPYLNMPLLGGLAYAALFLLTLGASWPKRWPWLRWGYALGGVLAIALILVQAWIVGAFCWLCMMVDAAAIGAALSAVLLARGSAAVEQKEGLTTWAWSALLVLSLGLPAAWMGVKPPSPTPDSILALGAPDKVTIVEFADFECPYCRKLHPILRNLVERRGESVHFLRLHMPLDQHPNSRAAARAGICAEHLGKGEAMADLLFSGELDDAAIESHALACGLNLAAFRACLTSPATEQRIERDVSLLRNAEFQGLPTTYIGKQRIVGLAAPEVYEEAVEEAAGGGGPRSVSGPVFLGLALLVLLAVVRAGSTSISTSPSP